MEEYLLYVVSGIFMIVILAGFIFTLIVKNRRLQHHIESAKKQLIQSERLSSLGLFTAGIAHEINNPINHISGASQVLFRTIDEGDLAGKEREIAFARNSIDEGLKNVQKITERLRTYSNSKSERVVPYDIINCLEDAMILLKPFYLGKVLIERNHPKTAIINCIPAKISQLLIATLGNAVEASNKGDKIYIHITESSQWLHIVIKDTGIGIPKDIQHKLFMPFITSKKDHLGLGLYIAQQIIEEHQGTLEIQSEKEGGTSVKIGFRLTVADQNDQTHPSIP